MKTYTPSLWSFSVHNGHFMLIVFTLLIAVGWSSFNNIPRSEDPAFPIPVTTVIVVWPGADALDVERRVVKPIEDRIAELEDIKELRGSAKESLGIVSVEFSWDSRVDPDQKYDEVARELNALRAELPDGITDLIIRKTNPSLTNIVQYALVSPTLDWRSLASLAEDLEETIESTPGIRRAERWAFPTVEVQVALDLPRLAALGLSPGAVLDRVSGGNLEIPGGAVEIADRRLNVEVTGAFESLDELADTVIAQRPEGVLRLRDVATVNWGVAAEQWIGRYNGERAVFVTANMQPGQNIFEVRAGIEQRVAGFAEQLPSDVRLELGFDQSRNVAHRLERLGIDFLIALGLVGITLLPLGLRAAALVMVAIPLSLAMGLACLYFTGFSLNQLSIAGFVLALGLLVDDAIVVVENIERYLRAGYTRAEAAIAATDQIAVAVLGCTAVLGFAFLPLLFLPEASGDFIRSLPAAVLYTVLASLLVAFTITPYLASRVLSRHSNPQGNWFLRQVNRAIHGVYAPLVARCLKHPWLSLAAAGALFVATLGLVPRIGFSLFPPADTPQFLITVRLPEGAALARTDAVVREIEQQLAQLPEVSHWFANVGHGNPQIYYNVIPLETQANVGELYVHLKAYDPDTTPALLDRLRTELEATPGAQVVVRAFENGPPIDAPIAVRVVGADLEVLRAQARAVEDIVRSTPGTRDVYNSQRLLRTDLRLGVASDKAALLGVSEADLERVVRLALSGASAGTYRDDRGDIYPIVLRAPINRVARIDALDQIYLTAPDGRSLPLKHLIEPELVARPASVDRYNRERSVLITAYPAAGANTQAVTAQIVASLDQHQFPAGYRYKLGGEAESAATSFGGMDTAILIATFGILAVLILEFGQFRSTLIVAGVIPLGISGALIALWLAGYTLSFTAVIGLIALVGVEIKNSILLVDFTNQLREDGVPLDEAIVRAGEIRFLPILLTTATAVGGLIPLVLERSGLYSPLAVVMIGGLIASTLLGRLITPVMYRLLPPTVRTEPRAQAAMAAA